MVNYALPEFNSSVETTYTQLTSLADEDPSSVLIQMAGTENNLWFKGGGRIVYSFQVERATETQTELLSVWIKTAHPRVRLPVTSE